MENEEITSAGNNCYPKIQTSQHGNLYEDYVKLLYILKCYKNVMNKKCIEFKVATQSEGFGKFDDLVGFIKDKDDKVINDCVQTKHKNEKKNISITKKEFVKDEGPFSLSQCFESVFKLLEQTQENSLNNDITNLVLSTNRIIADELKDFFVNCDEESEDILRFHNRSKRLKLKKSDITYLNWKTLFGLIKEFSGYQNMADMKLVISQKDTTKQYNIIEIKKNQRVNAPHIKVDENFKLNYIKDVSSEIYSDIDLLITDMESKNAYLKYIPICNLTLNNMPHTKVYVKDNGGKLLKMIEEFAERFVLYVDQPDIKELEDVIKEEIKHQFPNDNCDLIFWALHSYITQWTSTKEGYYITKETVDDILSSIKKQPLKLFDGFKNILNNDCIKFEENHLSKFHLDKGKIYFVKTKSVRLSTIKINQYFNINERSKKVIVGDATLFRLLKNNLLAQESFKDYWLIIEVNCKNSKGFIEEFIDSFKVSNMVFIVEDDSVDSLTKKEDTREIVENIKLIDLSIVAQNKILENKIKFQGHFVKLVEIIQDNDGRSFIEYEDLCKILENNFEIGENLNICQEFQHIYIERQLVGNFVKKDFVDNCYLPESVNENEWNQSAIELKDVLIISKNNIDVDSYKSARNIHWIKEQDGGYVLMRSKKKSNKVPKKHLTIEECKEDFVIIAAEPGMGKTTLFKRLATDFKKKFPSYWTIYVALTSNNADNEEESSLKIQNIEDAIKYFVQLAGIKDDLTKSLIERNLRKDGKIFMFLDGFDEMDETDQRKTLQMLDKCKELKTQQIWISTRKHYKDELENCVVVKCYDIKDLDEIEQIKLLANYWKTKTQKEMNFEEKAKDVLIKIKKAITSDVMNLIGIPLQLILIGEIFDVNSQIPERIDLLSLYDDFFEKKFKIYVQDKMAFPMLSAKQKQFVKSERKNLMDQLIGTALKLLFPEEESEWLKNSNISYDLIQLSSLGLFSEVIENVPQFIHRTFAEYFSAMWFVQEINWPQIRTFLQKQYFSKSFLVIRNFMNRWFIRGIENEEIFISVINYDQKTVDEALQHPKNINENILMSRDRAGRTLLHLMYLYSENLQDDSKYRIDTFLHNSLKNIGTWDRLLWFTPIKYAEGFDSLFLTNVFNVYICFEMFKIAIEIFSEKIIIVTQKAFNHCFDAVEEFDDYYAILYLCDRYNKDVISNYFKREFKWISKECPSTVSSSFGLEILLGNNSVLRDYKKVPFFYLGRDLFRLEDANEIFKTYGENALQYLRRIKNELKAFNWTLDGFPHELLLEAAKTGKWYFVRYLIDIKQLNVNYYNEKSHKSVLFWAIYHNNLEEADWLISKGANIKYVLNVVTFRKLDEINWETLFYLIKTFKEYQTVEEIKIVILKDNVAKEYIVVDIENCTLDYRQDIALEECSHADLLITNLEKSEVPLKFVICHLKLNKMNVYLNNGEDEIFNYHYSIKVEFFEKHKERIDFSLTKNCFNETVFHLAKDLEIIKYICSKITNYENFKDCKGNTPLHSSVLNDNIDIYEELLSIKEFIVLNDEGKLALESLMKNISKESVGVSKMLKYLTKHYKNDLLQYKPIELIDILFNENLEDYSKRQKVLYFIENLFELKQLNVDELFTCIEDKDGNNIFHFMIPNFMCSFHEYEERIYDNKEKFPDFIKNFLNAENNNGYTPLMLCTLLRNWEVLRQNIEFLCELGANVNHQNTYNKETALHLAVKYWNRPCVAILLDDNADPMIKDKNGMIPLDIAYQQMAKMRKEEGLHGVVMQEIIRMLKSHPNQMSVRSNNN